MLCCAATAQEPGDDHGDTRLSSTVIQRYGVSEPGRLNLAGDIDMFRLDLQGRAEVEMRTSGVLDTHGELYDDRGGLLTQDDDGGSDLNFRIVATLAGGVYYLAVASDTDVGTTR